MGQLDRDVIAPHRQLLNPGENTTLTRASILQSLKSSWLAAFPADWSDRLQSLGHSTWLLLKRPLKLRQDQPTMFPILSRQASNRILL